MEKPRVLVLSGYGLNCEEETAYAFGLAGGKAEIVHINDLIDGAKSLNDYQILAIPGGFSYSDDTGAGKALANRIKNNLWPEMKAFAAGDHLVIAICNGFQVLVNLGLVPALSGKYGQKQTALSHNDSARYTVRWVDLKITNDSPWLTGIRELSLPIAHGEGKFLAQTKTIKEMERRGLVALKYVRGEVCQLQNLRANPNGSLENIAGISDESGRILALMPHPERGIFFTQLPHWPWLAEKYRRMGKRIPRFGPGLAIFRNGVRYFIKTRLSYRKSGVDYAKVDPLKLLAQKTAKKTAKNLKLSGFSEVSASRGESAYVVDGGDFYLASITECLGTKSLVAEAMGKISGKSYYDLIAQDTIAMAVNDVLTVGAKPVSIHAYWSTGNSRWFEDTKKMRDLVLGWKKACDLAGAAWGGGETPVLNGIIRPGTIDLAASCVGVIKPKTNLVLGEKLSPGDAIVLFESSGIHANGLSLARRIAGKLEKGYATIIDNKVSYGEALLKPTIIYAPMIMGLFDGGIKIHYMANITGHGWCKLMRHPKRLTYRITKIPPVPKVLGFMVEKGGLETSEAYGSLNMGAGFAVFVPRREVDKVVAVGRKVGVRAYLAGRVEKGPRQVVIEPLNIVFGGKKLQIRV